MKSSSSKILTALLLLLFSPSLLHAWCWIRDTGNTSVGCAPSLIKSTCCDGNLRRWPNGILSYHISTTTDPSLIPLIQSGINAWNNVEMSTFTLAYQGTSTAAIGNTGPPDGINLVAINPNFTLIGQGILAISTTTEIGANTENYRAVGSDIEFNGVEHIWGDGTGGTIDTISVVAHEAGHNIGLNHAGATCQNEGSEGCGPDFPDATMYWNLGTANKGSLELDDIAALIYGYPKSTFTVKVLNPVGTPIPGATVTLLDAAAPVNGTTPEEGGRVYGDVTNPLTLVGEKAPSATYVDQTPFQPTNAQGLTNTIFPTRRNIRLRASFGGVTQTVAHTLADGVSTRNVIVATSQTDLVGPLLSITSHNSGDAVNTSPLLLNGTATDAGRGDSGIQQVAVNGTQTNAGTTTGAGTASWSASVLLTTGNNTLTIQAWDNAPTPNITTQSLSIIYDTDPPAVSLHSPLPNGTAATINDVISVQFTEPMDASTLTPLTFISNNGLSGAISYDAASRSASFTPDAPLAPLTTYTFTLTTGVRDMAGNQLASPVSWSFSTQDASATPASSSSGGGGCFIHSAK